MYMAPEVVIGLPYNERADVYSFGVVFYNVVSCDVCMGDFKPCHMRLKPHDGPAWVKDVWAGALTALQSDRKTAAELLLTCANAGGLDDTDKHARCFHSLCTEVCHQCFSP